MLGHTFHNIALGSGLWYGLLGFEIVIGLRRGIHAHRRMRPHGIRSPDQTAHRRLVAGFRFRHLHVVGVLLGRLRVIAERFRHGWKTWSAFSEKTIEGKCLIWVRR